MPSAKVAANVSARKTPGHARDWRQVLQSQDAEAIWQQLSILNLIATDRISHYLENDYSDSEIRADLLEALGE